MNQDEGKTLAEGIASIFLRCFFLSVALLLLWFVFYFMAGDWAYSIHSRWFGLSRRDFGLIHYYGMAVTKTCAILFFLFPYLSIKLVLRKKERNT
jgi:hypothetical protein